MRETPRRSTEDLDLATVLHALSDPARLVMVRRLATGEASCAELTPPGSAKSTCSHHLRVLREAGVTDQRVDGTYKYSRLRRDDLEARFPGLLTAVIDAASV